MITDFIPDSDLLTFQEKSSQIMDTCVFYIEIFTTHKRSENDKCPTLDIVIRRSSMYFFGDFFLSFDDDRVIISDMDIDTSGTKHIDQTHDVWLDRGECDRRFSFSESIRDDQILCRCDRESSHECHIPFC